MEETLSYLLVLLPFHFLLTLSNSTFPTFVDPETQSLSIGTRLSISNMFLSSAPVASMHLPGSVLRRHLLLGEICPLKPN